MKVLKFILKRKCPNETFDDNDFADLTSSRNPLPLGRGKE